MVRQPSRQRLLHFCEMVREAIRRLHVSTLQYISICFATPQDVRYHDSAYFTVSREECTTINDTEQAMLQRQSWPASQPRDDAVSQACFMPDQMLGRDNMLEYLMLLDFSVSRCCCRQLPRRRDFTRRHCRYVFLLLDFAARY